MTQEVNTSHGPLRAYAIVLGACVLAMLGFMLAQLSVAVGLRLLWYAQYVDWVTMVFLVLPACAIAYLTTTYFGVMHVIAGNTKTAVVLLLPVIVPLCAIIVPVVLFWALIAWATGGRTK